MSYNVWAHYVAETTRKNRLEALHKPRVGILSGRNAPGYWTNDTCFPKNERKNARLALIIIRKRVSGKDMRRSLLVLHACGSNTHENL
jgi:hypothetical protein